MAKKISISEILDFQPEEELVEVATGNSTQPTIKVRFSYDLLSDTKLDFILIDLCNKHNYKLDRNKITIDNIDAVELEKLPDAIKREYRLLKIIHVVVESAYAEDGAKLFDSIKTFQNTKNKFFKNAILISYLQWQSKQLTVAEMGESLSSSQNSDSDGS